MPTERIPLAVDLTTRDGTLQKDSRTVNAVFEKDGSSVSYTKRPGLTFKKQIDTYKKAKGMTALGNNLIINLDTTIYSYSQAYDTVTTIGSTTSTNFNTYFARSFQDTYAFFHNGLDGYVITDAGVLTNVSTPSHNMCAGAVYLDDYMFYGDRFSNLIYSSKLGDATSWNSLASVAFYQTTDSLVGIAKHLNYLVAFGKSSMSFYYDSGTGSDTVNPLQLAASYSAEIGCASGDTISTSSNTVVWVGTTKSHGKTVYMLEGVSPIKISTSSVDKVLELSNYERATSYIYKFWGHTLYVLTLHDLTTTLVYDMDNKLWTQWTQYAAAASDQPNPGTYYESYFRGAFYANLNDVPYVIDDDSSTLSYLSTASYQDNGQPIYCRAVSELHDMGSTHKKFYGRLEVVGDRIENATCSISHTSDDYNTFSTPRTVSLNSSRPQMYQGGSDRRRAWSFLSTSNTPIRLEYLEIDFRMGELDQEQNIGGGRQGG
jgi:hypothetical protein